MTGSANATFSLQPASVRRLLIALRSLAAGLLVLALALMTLAGVAPQPAAWLLPGVLLGFNLALWCRGGNDKVRIVVPAWALAAHLAFDTLVLFALFWLVGGATNPFVSLFLLPVALAGAALDIRGAVAVTVLSILGYTALLWRYLARLGDPTAVIGFERHVVGMWATFVLAAVLLCGFLLALAGRLRASERALGEQRERLMRDDAVVSVATVAAGAAHALNTPLATIVLAAESLGEDTTLSPTAREEAATIRSQAEVAADALRALVAARDPQAQDRTDIAEFITDVLARWQQRRPEIETRQQESGTLPARVVRRDPALAQAIHNLLDNAADAAIAAGRPTITIICRYQRGHVVLCIDDPGPALAGRAGTRMHPTSSKPGGLGLGVTLARASLARLDGRLVYEAAPEGGTRTRIEWPVAARPTTGL